MAELEAELVKLEATLSDDSLFSKNPKRFDQTSRRITAARHELHAAEEQWLELEMLREEIENA